MQFVMTAVPRRARPALSLVVLLVAFPAACAREATPPPEPATAARAGSGQADDDAIVRVGA